MKKVSIIARAELGNLFYSPIAWILLIIFLVQCSLAFADATHVYIILQKYHKLFPNAPFSTATLSIMTDKQTGMFPKIVDKLYLYLPLLTMGLISREVGSGTIRLLYSSPVKTGQIVLGKFLAMVVYSMLLVVVLAMFVGVAVWTIPYVDTGMLLSSLVGFFLLLCAYSAIGLFMSCLTSYQVVAALSTLAVFAALHYLGQIGQGIDFVRDLTWFLSLGSRTGTMFQGLITSRDVLYFVIITALFLGFSIFRLQADQAYRPLWLRISRYAGLTVIATALIYFSSRPALVVYADTTDAASNTITPATQALVKSMGDEPLEITAYVNLLDMNYRLCAPQTRNSYLQFWDPYVRFNPDIKFSYVYYYDTTAYTKRTIEQLYKGKTIRQVAEEYAKTNDIDIARFLTPEQAHKIPGLKLENGRLVMQLRHKGRTAFVRIFNDMQKWPSEEQIAAALKCILQPETAPTIGFLEGELERRSDPAATGDREYSAITTGKLSRSALVNNGFDIKAVEEGQDIPSTLDALVIADPKQAFSGATMSQLRKYIAGGGNMLIMAEPGKQPVINPLLQTLGVQLQNGILVQQNKEEVPDMVTPALTETAANMSETAASLYNSHQPVFLTGAAVLDYDNKEPDSIGAFAAEPLLTLNGQNSWQKMGELVNDSAAVVFDAADGDQHARYFVPAVALTREINGHQQRIAVIADADFMSNREIKLRQTNPYFSVALYKWVSNGKFPIELARLPPKDLLAPTDGQLSTVKILFVWLLPGLLLLAGAVLLIRRKRQ